MVPRCCGSNSLGASRNWCKWRQSIRPTNARSRVLVFDKRTLDLRSSAARDFAREFRITSLTISSSPTLSAAFNLSRIHLLFNVIVTPLAEIILNTGFEILRYCISWNEIEEMLFLNIMKRQFIRFLFNFFFSFCLSYLSFLSRRNILSLDQWIIVNRVVLFFFFFFFFSNNAIYYFQRYYLQFRIMSMFRCWLNTKYGWNNPGLESFSRDYCAHIYFSSLWNDRRHN